MIKLRCYVAVVSLTTLLVGCFSTEKKKDLAKIRGSNIIDESKIKSNCHSKDSQRASTENEAEDSHNHPSTAVVYRFDESLSLKPKTITSYHFGTSHIDFPVYGKEISGPSFDILLPIKNADQHLLFSQLGVRKQEKNSIVNIGFGQRLFFDQWMVGYNTFLDAQLTGNQHRRGGIGLELWHDNFKLSTNGYYRLSEWKTSSLLTDSRERVANGFDIVAQSYFPAYAQLGAKIKYEQWFGKDVATVSRQERHKDPSALTLGLTYTPVPLVTLAVDHSKWSHGKHESKLNLGINYRFNVPLAKQLDPQYTPLARSLAGSRTDRVQRNNNIVLEYQAQKQKLGTITIQLPTELKGHSGEEQSLNVTITTQHELDRIVWDSGSYSTAGGSVNHSGKSSVRVKFPKFNPLGENHYLISAVAYDKQGNNSNRAEMTIIIEPNSEQAQLPEQSFTDKNPQQLQQLKLTPPSTPATSTPSTPPTSTSTLPAPLSSLNHRPVSTISQTGFLEAIKNRKKIEWTPESVEEIKENSDKQYALRETEKNKNSELHQKLNVIRKANNPDESEDKNNEKWQ